MKRNQSVILIGLVVAIILSGYLHKKEENTAVPERETYTVEPEKEVYSAASEDNQPTIESKLVGTWYCSRQNSCNDMEITLEISQDGNTAYLHRDMVSESGIGSSDLYGSAYVAADDNLYAEFTFGKYYLTDEGYLLEYFFRSDQWNLYTRDGFTEKMLVGRYAEYVTD